jgi:Fic family protein
MHPVCKGDICYDNPDNGSPRDRVFRAPCGPQGVYPADAHCRGHQMVRAGEDLHPFLDGNGRLGRMLIPLFLYQAGIIQQPMFYISAYLESHSDEYYERLLAVSRDNDWNGWCAFFLKVVQIQAEENLAKAQTILDLYNRMKIRFAELTHSQYAIFSLDWVIERPIFKSSELVRSSSIPNPTAKRILALLKEDGILREIRSGSGRRAAILAFSELLNIAEGYEAF